MNTGDPVDVLLTQDRWAMLRLLDACERLTAEQFHQRFEIGLGSLHDSILHILSANRASADVLAGRPQRPPIDLSQRRSVAEMRAMVEEAAADLAAHARSGPPDQLLQRARQDRVYTYTRATILVHSATHGAHHRAQCLNMLRQLGVAPLPQSGVFEWSRAGCPEQ
ncbi:MAG TPA: DinB family protein [Phycisphaerales bacterium]|nr:DinB family protein [Phycisphaerales bacterium]